MLKPVFYPLYAVAGLIRHGTVLLECFVVSLPYSVVESFEVLVRVIKWMCLVPLNDYTAKGEVIFSCPLTRSLIG